MGFLRNRRKTEAIPGEEIREEMERIYEDDYEYESSPSFDAEKPGEELDLEGRARRFLEGESRPRRQTRPSRGTSKNRRAQVADYQPGSKKKRMIKKRKKKHYGLKLLLLLAIIVGLVMFARSSFFDVNKIIAVDGDRYTAEQIIEMSGLEAKGNIFNLKTGDAIKALEADPYIGEVTIEKQYPDKIKITVTERTEEYAVYFDHNYSIVDQEGYVLRTTDEKPTDMPRIVGCTVTSNEENALITVEEERKLSQAMEIIDESGKADVVFAKVDVTNPMVLCYVNDLFTVKGYNEDIVSNLQNGTVKAVLDDLASKGVSKGTVTVGDDQYCSFSPEIQ